jgi:cysteine desulfurase family protein
MARTDETAEATLDSDSPLIYLDHAATSFPKPPGVAEAMVHHLARRAVNPGRAGYDAARLAAADLDRLRARCDRLFNNPAAAPDRCVFTANATDALNLAIGGVCRDGDHVVTTAIEHNSVLRPLHALQRQGRLTWTVVPCDAAGRVDPDAFAAALRADTALAVLGHASNVCGAVQPVAALTAACRDRGVPVLLDAAQTAGTLPVDMAALGVDLVAFTGHKGLLGPTGTGGLVVGPGVDVASTRWGGTGVRSAEADHPQHYPHRLEAGTLNGVGLAGLAAALDWLDSPVGDGVLAHERRLADRFLAACRETVGVTVVGMGGGRPDALGPERLAVVSLTVAGQDPERVGAFLDVDHGLAVRTGLHCAPLIHQAPGTHPAGAVRFSFGPFNTEAHVDAAAAALAAVARG